MSKGIKDRAAVAGVGCTKFGERWEADAEDLLVDAVSDALDDAGISRDDIDAAWVGNAYPFSGSGGTTLADPLKLYGIPITRVENFCATGMDAFRNACLGVASGVYDIALACGVEKILDQSSKGLPGIQGIFPAALSDFSAPGLFGLLTVRTFDVYGWTREDLAEVAVKNHANGEHHPKAHFQKAITLDEALNAPMISWPLARFDCCAISDGAAAVIVTRPEIARTLKHKDDYTVVKANAMAVGSGMPFYESDFDWLGWPANFQAARMAYEEAGIDNPLKEISFAEVHDCFTVNELLSYEAMGFCERGKAPQWLRDGGPTIGGELPVNPSGGLKCFGHPIGATGCRMIYEVTTQLQGRADGLQVPNARLGLANNLGGTGAVSTVTILGRGND
ncbi:MAG: acetyl-CoA acetyltransferase [Actinomycetota bacterium]